MNAPCNCAARWASVDCRCSWRDHLTKPVSVNVGWLYDDGTTTHDATLSGLVYPDGSTDEMEITIDGGESFDVPASDVASAEDDLRYAASLITRRAS